MRLYRTARPHLAAVSEYRPGKPIEEVERELGIRGAVKMASNENALGPSPKAVAAARGALGNVHRYPDGGCFYLRRELSKRLGVKPESIVFANGSDEALVMAVRAFAGPGDEVIVADPTFLIYGIAAAAAGARVVRVPMRDFRYDLGSMAARVSPKTKLIFVANPDNPVGTYVTVRELAAFLGRIPKSVVVVLDEAYFEFAAREKKDYPDGLKFLKVHPNLVVTRTFSKAYGLAGLRVGYAASNPEIAAALNKVREPFNVNLPAQAAALAALSDSAHLGRTLKAVSEGRKLLERELGKMGLVTVDTATNFILIDLGARDAEAVYEKLLRKGVIVRSMAAWGLRGFLRVTIGRPADNRRFLRALKETL